MSFWATLRTHRGWFVLPWLALLLLAWAVWQWQLGLQTGRERAAFDRAANLPAQALAEVTQEARPQGQRVWLAVRDSAASVRIANAWLHGRDGVRQWQAVQLADGSWVVIDRGWLARPAAVLLLPLPAGRLFGRWVPRPPGPSGPLARLGVAGEVDGLDWPALARQLPGPLRQGLVVLDPALRPHTGWPVAPAADPQPHYRQAACGLTLALVLLLLSRLLPRRQV
jgi:hypothetical protein